MRKLNRYLCILLTIFILSSQSIAYNENEESTSDVIYIYTVEDLIMLSENCTLDSYSQNKIVKLAANIDLSDTDFQTIPIFSGIFDGNHYTISNFNSSSVGSNQGLFRYLQEEGVIKNLHVKGTIKPSGSKKEVGGIVSNNKGLITSCSFKGEVIGDTSIGAIVGYNDKTGIIENCQSMGLVIGEHYTGGIVGLNAGYVKSCTNDSNVNTTNDAIPNKDMTSYNLKNLNINNINSTENLDAQIDIGGIVGYNQGIIELSENHGNIGYQHVGYNIGGIAGRQSGYISNCKNFGLVNGRKDVGGVVGQAEPFIRLLFSEDTLQRIDEELIDLNKLIDKAINEGDKSSSVIISRLESLNSITTSASDKMQNLINNTTDYIDESTTIINTTADRIRHVMTRLEPVIENFKKASDELTNSFDKLETGFYKLEKASSYLNDSIEDLNDAFEDLDKASRDASLAFDKMSKAMKLVEKAAENSEEVDEALKELDSALLDLQLAMEAGIRALDKLAEALEKIDNPIGEDWDVIIGELRDELETMSKHMNEAMPKIRHALSVLSKEFKDDQALIKEALAWMDLAMQDLEDFTKHTNNAFAHIQDSLDDIDSVSSATKAAMKYFSKGMGHFSNASAECSNGLEELKSIFKEINAYEKLQLPKLSDYITESSDSLFDEMNNISNELALLNTEAKDTSESFHNNLRAINKQFEVIADIIRDGLNSISFDNEDLFEDISDQNLQEEPAIEKGLIRDCYNEGTILGDVNVGGIAGSMAIEYDFDPEDDIINKGNHSFNFKYQTISFLMSSVNNGIIQAKKDCAGGITGKMDLGLITTSENYGSIENLDGNYTGGIVGSSSSVIRKCYSLSELSGKNYVGGIAGYATDIYDSLSLVQINKSNEYAGAIAGDITGKFENNSFVKCKWEGVDGISYSGKATPQAYDSFILNEGLPEAFKSFQLTFVVNDDIIKTIPFKYGDSLSLEAIPDIPKKEGYYGSWPEYNYNNLVFSKKLEAIYTPMIQVLASDDKSHSKLLVEGAFNPDDTLNINEIYSSDTMIKNYPVTEEWSVQLNTASNKPLTFRFLKPESKNVVLYQRIDNSEWQELKTTVDGSYLLFESDLTNFSIAAVEKKSNIVFYVLALVLIVIIVLVIFKKKSRNAKKVKAT